jgi:hypothetical protein
MSKQLIYWDFTLHCHQKGELIHVDIMDHCQIQKWLLEYDKNMEGNFQLEQGEGGAIHWQGRMKLKNKTTKYKLAKLSNLGDWMPNAEWSPTSNNGKKNYDYVTKDCTRLEGPFNIQNKEKVKSRQLKKILNLIPFQESLVKIASTPDDRQIDVVFNESGCQGKTALCEWMDHHDLAKMIPPVNNYKDIMRLVMCHTRIREENELPSIPCFIIDMPRSLKKDKLGDLYSGIETLKQGYVFDDRYQFEDKWIDRPRVIVMCNVLPNFELLSADMWKIWTIENKHLTPYNASDIPNTCVF